LAACADLPDSCGPGAGATTGYRLGAGDQLRVTVFRQPDLSGPLQVDGQGYLAMPLVGRIPAAGLTTQALQEAIKARLREGAIWSTPTSGSKCVPTGRSTFSARSPDPAGTSTVMA
jgi:polysaccharide biosynthesis/export protein